MDKVRRQRERDLHYLAGIIDGEGCFNIGRCRASYVPRILIVNTNYRLCKWLVDRFGGNVQRSVVKNRTNWKPRYFWRLSHRKALDLAREVANLLHLKKIQARYFVVWAAIMDVFTRSERAPFYEIITERIKKLNRKGTVQFDAI